MYSELFWSVFSFGLEYGEIRSTFHIVFNKRESLLIEKIAYVFIRIEL